MKLFCRALALFALASTLAAGGAAAARSVAPTQSRTVASWPFTAPYGSFAESMALGGDGYLYVSRTVWGETTDVGFIHRVSPRGGITNTVAGPIDVDGGLIAGVAFDPKGRLYVALATFSADNPPGVARVGSNGTLTRVLTLPPDSFPNGLAFHGGVLYVTDPALGAIWTARTDGRVETPVQPWLEDPALAHGQTLGPDGIAFRGDTLFVTQYDRGQILSVDVSASGHPGTLHVFAQSPALVSADGMVFDPLGNLWVTVNGPGTGRLVVVSPSGHVVVMADQPAWLDYPTQPVLVLPGTLYIANGSFDNGAPNVTVFGPIFHL